MLLVTEVEVDYWKHHVYGLLLVSLRVEQKGF